jgi:hypothetical protein
LKKGKHLLQKFKPAVKKTPPPEAQTDLFVQHLRPSVAPVAQDSIATRLELSHSMISAFSTTAESHGEIVAVAEPTKASPVRPELPDQGPAEANFAEVAPVRGVLVEQALTGVDVLQEASARVQPSEAVSAPELYGAALALIEPFLTAVTVNPAGQVDQASDQIILTPGNAQIHGAALAHTASLQAASAGINAAQVDLPPDQPQTINQVVVGAAPPAIPGNATPQNATRVLVSAGSLADKLQARNVPMWNMALATFKRENKNGYNEIEEKAKVITKRGKTDFPELTIPK